MVKNNFMENIRNKSGSVFVLLLGLAMYFGFFQLLACVPVNIHYLPFVLELFVAVICTYLFIASSSKTKTIGKKVNLILYPSLLITLGFIIACIIGGPYTGGLENYRNQSPIREIDFSEVPEFDATQVQLVDKNTAIQIGDRVFGTLGSDEVSQYEVGDDWTQISLNGRLYRVTPIDFGGLFKYFITRTTPGYIIVDCNNGEAKLVRTEGMQYMKSSYFFKDIRRHLFLSDPFSIKATPRFELDDNGKPFWVTPVLKKTFVSKTTDVKGVYICDPQDGKTQYYEKGSIPAWVDNVYPIDIVYTQFKQSKRYENGLFNFSNKGVVEFTDDYAYVQFNDNVHIYTGVTSVGKDESNVGFAYVDLRNGEIRYIRRAGAEEYSARSSAEGALQQYHYTAIFPSMVNVRNVPTYFMGLVDGANLIKSYAFVSYENYQNVGYGATVNEAYSNYLKFIGAEAKDDEPKQTSEISFTVSDVQIITVDGNSIVLIMDENQNIYHYELSNGDYRASFLKQNVLIKALVDENNSITEFIEITAREAAVPETPETSENE